MTTGATKYKKISMIIVNKNDRGIADTLAALQQLSSPLPYEIVVIDASEGKLDAIRDKFTDIRWFAFTPLPHRRTIAEQRNMGVKKATGDIVVFIDASCVPTSGWLDALTYPILYEDEHIVAGAAVPKGGTAPHSQASSQSDEKVYLSECPTINLAITKRVFHKVGTFDERLGHAEDVDFIWRAIDAGLKVRQVSLAVVTHDWGNRAASIERSFRYGIGRAKLYKKHPRRWRGLFSADIRALAYPIYIVGLPITLLFWPYPLLIAVPLLLNLHDQPLRTTIINLVYGLGVLKGIFESHTGRPRTP